MTMLPEAARPALARDAAPANPTRLRHPAFLLNAPFSFSTEVPNNIWMREYPEQERPVDHHRAMAQFLRLQACLAEHALVYVLPTPRTSGLQDLVFTANLGIALDHLPDGDDVVVANFTSAPRRGETEVGVGFFESMGYRTHVAPHRFEGEADLKHLHGNVYVGGWGMRSDPAVHDWFERTFDMRIVRVEMTDPYLYHLDCCVFPLTREHTLVCTEAFTTRELDELARHTEIIDVSMASSRIGLCNSVRLDRTVVNGSNLHGMRPGTEEHRMESAKNDELAAIADAHGLGVTHIDLSEYHKGGADLSCMVMHLNRYSYDRPASRPPADAVDPEPAATAGSGPRLVVQPGTPAGEQRSKQDA
ncbi:amidinotransferase [Saccharopolyspora erythraea]|uniref:dimethylarginine dimethylaminohydrolase family protein n=1 Tax=Saccharopolyspora erythraea TaxID=1836 RepID=UPI001BAB5381|nr:amidinotransferase [Saccharopolyspora erythraea]QUH02335.1 amidinotransferase [Saccharopolyspora erythraea]